MRSDRAGCSGLHVGPFRFSLKIDEKVGVERAIFHEVLFERRFLEKLGKWGPNGASKWPKGAQWDFCNSNPPGACTSQC